ncbi:hypothetical protein KPS64_gp51 [Shigella phage KPS64]|uniref:Uncharacterized protein n=2 Tax=Mooglevirus Sf17 TaxID=2560758 RepID=A0A482JM90_9CAUD|nr:hypothetical protein Sf19_gp63 [Shigella phage Sf19]QBP32814.1 hypothetical protein KPS64_gp51 [Shigella phage KPS64]
MSLPLKLDLYFGYSVLQGSILSLPKSDYRCDLGSVKRASHFNNNILGLQTLHRWLEEDGRLNEYLHQLELAKEEGHMGWNLLPHLYKPASPMEIRYNEQAIDSYNKYNITIGSRPWKEYGKLREIIIQTIGKRVAKGIAYDEKVDWNTQKCIKFFKYDNDKDTFVEV